MKKIYTILIGAGILLSMISIPVLAESLNVEVDKSGIENSELDEVGILEDELLDSTSRESNEYGIKEKIKERFKNKKERFFSRRNSDKSFSEFKLRGIWGYSDDNESDGYLAGKIVKRPRKLFFKGLYNKTDSEEYGKVLGIMKKGYFNGRLINPEGEKCHLIGLYKFDRENNTIKMKWMTPHISGWSGAKILIEKE